MAAAAPNAIGRDRTMPAQARAVTEVVTRLRRALRTSIRTDYPWESLPMAQVEVLLTLHEHQPARVGELAHRLRLAPSTVSGLVQALVESGYATRAPDLSDRRVAVVTLTEAGQTKLVEWDQAHQQRIDDALGQLSADDRAAVQAALPALARFVDHLAGLRPGDQQRAVDHAAVDDPVADAPMP